MKTASVERARLNRRWMQLALFALVLVSIMGVRLALSWERSWHLTINWTESLPDFAYIIDKGADPAVGDYVEFVPPENPFYRKILFVKRIVAGPGQTVECRGRAFYVDGRQVALAKENAKTGEPLTLGPCGVVPADHYFVTTPHKDSFDSRYGEIGYVAHDRIRGVAWPVL